MPPPRSPKKTETIEVRLSDEAKAAFMAHCRDQGRTASDTVRTLIEGVQAPRRRPPAWRALAAGLAGLALGAGFAAPSFARSAPADRAAFDRLDRDHDQRLSYAEFAAR